jgi:hypothetical protein
VTVTTVLYTISITNNIDVRKWPFVHIKLLYPFLDPDFLTANQTLCKERIKKALTGLRGFRVRVKLDAFKARQKERHWLVTAYAEPETDVRQDLKHFYSPVSAQTLWKSSNHVYRWNSRNVITKHAKEDSIPLLCPLASSKRYFQSYRIHTAASFICLYYPTSVPLHLLRCL